MNQLRTLIFIIVLMTFDDLVIKIFQLSPASFNAARYSVDILYVLLSSVILLNRWPSPMVRPALLFSIFLLVVTVGATSILRDDFRSNIDFLFVTLRYLPIGAALATFDRDAVRGALGKAFNAIFLIQIIASIPQVLQIETAVTFLLPQQIDGLDTRVATDLDSWDGDIFGTFSQTISLAFFLVFYIVFRKYEYNFSIIEPRIVLACIMIYLTQSFAAIFTMLLLFLYWRGGWMGLFTVFVAAVLASNLLLTIVYINGFSLNEYIQISETSRVGIILYTLPSYIESASFSEILLGIGRNIDVIKSVVFSARYVPEIFVLSKNVAPLEDVYYVALFMYFGVFGFIAYVCVYLTCVAEILRKHAGRGHAALAMSFVVALATSVNQILSVQIVSVSYWALVGLAMARPAFKNGTKNG